MEPRSGQERFKNTHGLERFEEMDNTQRKLLLLLSANPRISLQELAWKLGKSRQSVHHRLQELKVTGVIRGVTAGVSFAYLDAIPVAVFGRARLASAERILDRLGESELTRRVVIAGGNYVYAVGELRSLAELDGYVDFVKRGADMHELTVGLFCLDDVLSPEYFTDGVMTRRESYKGLSDLDYKIIASLKDDGRRPVAEVAQMVGVSRKTVGRHIEQMIADGSLELHVMMDSPSEGPLLTIAHMDLKEGGDKVAVSRRLIEACPFPDAYVRAFSNIPGFVMLVFWCDCMRDVCMTLKRLSDDGDVKSIVPNFAYLERVYTSTWRDKLPEGSGRPPRRDGTRGVKSRNKK